ncbi:MAG: oxidoreductase, partial [Planctomycetes bacterium]|nr:oxidoreductase [Planctomycetota bacterium]
MTTALFVMAVGLLVSGAVACALAGRRAVLANRLGAGVAVAGALPAAAAAAAVLWGGGAADLRLPWSVPFGTFHLALDGLSALFALAIAVVSGLAAVYGAAYLKHESARRNLGAAWCFYNLLLASMLLVVAARNGVLFLVAWELMSLASFFLVMFDHQRREVRDAGWIYLASMHLGTALLLGLFVLLGWQEQTMDFDRFTVPASVVPGGVLFMLALIGFGTKAGFVPMHVWLPEAHPAAPSHVSAVMSGVMIKTGIYGLLRTLMFLGPPAAWPAWWGWTL